MKASDKNERARKRASNLVFIYGVFFNFIPFTLWQARLMGNLVIAFLLLPSLAHFAAALCFVGKNYNGTYFFASVAIMAAKVLSVIPKNPLALGLPRYLNTKIIALINLEDTKEAIDVCRDALRILEKQDPPDKIQIAHVKILLGTCDSMRGNYAEAEKITRSAIADMEACGADQRQIANALTDLSTMLTRKGKIEASIETGRKALAIRERMISLNSNDPELKKQDEIMLGMTLNNLAVCLEESGFAAESLEFYERSLKIKSEIFGEKSKEAAIGRTNLGYTLLCLDKSESGAEHCDRARQIALDLGINTSNQRIWTAILCNYAHGLRRLGRVDEAEKTQLEAAATREKVKDPQVHESYQELGLIYLEKRELDKAKNYFEKALSIREKSYGKEHPRVGSTLSAYAKVFRLQNQNSRADEMENLAAKIESKRARI